ncbi:MAG: M23 family metallopeptidase [Pseudonocardiaceae bacterium]
MIMAVLSGGLPGGLSSQASPADPVAPTDPVARADPVAPVGPDEVGEQPAPRFGWPLPGSPTVVRAFHPPAFRYGPGHRGVDLAATPGAPVLAAGAGTVAFAGTVAGHGVVSVDHPDGLRTTYEPVSPTVTVGDRVTRGERIGTVAPGHPGCPSAACLHWGVLRWSVPRDPAQDRQYLDPLRLLPTARVRLLPINSPPGDARGPQPAEASSILLRSRSTALVCS